MTKRYKLECLGDEVVMIVDKEKGVAFDGWDERSEMAFIGFGDTERSPCWIVARAIVEVSLDDELVTQIEENNNVLVEALIIAGADIEAKDRQRETPLHHAIWKSRCDIVEILLKLNANIEAEDYFGRTPLHHAIWTDRYEVVETLLKHGANIKAETDDGETPLQHALRLGHNDVIALLEEWGATQ